MNIEGLDYNTQREQLVLPEYGREVQKMVDHAVGLPSKEERQHCAETIVAIMDRMFPQNRENPDYRQKLWDHLAIMSNFQLDIDWPFDISGAAKIATKPEPLDYPMSQIPVRHYGKMIFELFEQLKTMPPGEERDELVRETANQMKRNLYQWSQGLPTMRRLPVISPVSPMAVFSWILIVLCLISWISVRPHNSLVKRSVANAVIYH